MHEKTKAILLEKAETMRKDERNARKWAAHLEQQGDYREAAGWSLMAYEYGAEAFKMEFLASEIRPRAKEAE